MMMPFNRKSSVLVLLASLLAAGPGCTLVPQIPDTVPDFEAATFSNPTQIDNNFLPLEPATVRTYRAETADGTERTVVEVLDETKVVYGVTVRVVRDRVYLNDVLVEDTHDWFAQDDDGNVWYMGEEVDNYEYDVDGNPLPLNHDGAWEAGKDVAGVGEIARPGHVMKASPMVGDLYHQEYYPGEAEDMGEVVALNVSVTLADGTTYTGCLQTRDFTRLEPGVAEHKYYAPGIGLVVEEKVGGGERAELVSISMP